MNSSLFYNHNLIFHYIVLYGFGEVFDSITFDEILKYCVFAESLAQELELERKSRQQQQQQQQQADMDVKPALQGT